MLSEVCEKACFILHETNDGDDLAPEHLYLVQCMVNDHCTDIGKQMFQELYENVKGGYVRPWFHGIEHLTYDHAGYVRYKGHIVEHYDSPFAWSERARQDAGELARRCRLLEENELDLTVHNAIWVWEKLCEEHGFK